jgi:hypothetical protein
MILKWSLIVELTERIIMEWLGRLPPWLSTFWGWDLSWEMILKAVEENGRCSSSNFLSFVQDFKCKLFYNTHCTIVFALR